MLRPTKSKRAAKRIAVLADVAELVDKVEEREQQQQRDEDEHRREQHFAADVARERLHECASRRRNSPPIESRFQNRSTITTAAMLWIRINPASIDKRPCAMKLCTMLRQLL